MVKPLRLLVFDDTCHGASARWLSEIWATGAQVFRGQFDGYLGAQSWSEALEWLGSFEVERPIAEIQYWGHGNFGSVRLGQERLDRESFQPMNPLYPGLVRLRGRLEDSKALIWFRTCEAFGTAKGQTFAEGCAQFFGCRVAGHTFVIAWAQSGLHVLAPGEKADWSVDEGVDSSTDPKRALWSTFRSPRTVPFLRMKLPKWA